MAASIGLNELPIVNWERCVGLPRQYWQVKRLCEVLHISYENVLERLASDLSGQGFGPRLSKARIIRALKQEEAATLAGMDPTTLMKRERSPAVPAKWMQDKYKKLGQVLGIVDPDGNPDLVAVVGI